MSLVRATALVGALTLLSRIAGFVRDMLIARLLGAGLGADAFLVAFKIPNFVRRLFTEGAFAAALVPLLAEGKARGDEAEVRDLVAHITGMLGLGLLVITAVGVIAAPLLIWIFAPGFALQADKYALAQSLLRITFPYVLFISLTALAGALLNSYGRFAVPAFTPLLLNLVLIGVALGIAPHTPQPALALAWGVFGAGLVQLALQVPFLLRLKLLPRPRWDAAHAGVRRLLRLMGPALFGSSVAQINLLLDTVIASFLATGSVAWLYYADRVVEFPLGLFGVALGAVILPSLARDHAQQTPAAFNQTLDWALRCALLVGIPATLALVVLAPAICATLYQYGAFTTHDTRMAAQALAAYAVGLLALVLVKVLAPGYYARHDTRTPVRAGVIAVVANLGFSLILVWPLQHTGLALAASLSACINAALLYRGLRRSGVYQPPPGWGRLGVQLALANAVLLAALLWATDDAAQWSHWGGAQRVWHTMGLCGGGAAVYFLALWLAGARVAHFRPPRPV